MTTMASNWNPWIHETCGYFSRDETGALVLTCSPPHIIAIIFITGLLLFGFWLGAYLMKSWKESRGNNA